jgi:hypothetical protein
MMSMLSITSRGLETQKPDVFSLTIFYNDLTKLIINGSYVKEKLYGHLFTSVNQVINRHLAQENQSK